MTLRRAMSVTASAPTIFALISRPSDSRTRTVRAPTMTCRFVTIRPSSRMTNPEPREPTGPSSRPESPVGAARSRRMIAPTALGSESAAARLSARSAARSAAPIRSSSTRIVTTLGATRRTSAAYPEGWAQLTAPTNGPESAMRTNTARRIHTFHALLERIVLRSPWCSRRVGFYGFAEILLSVVNVSKLTENLGIVRRQLQGCLVLDARRIEFLQIDEGKSLQVMCFDPVPRNDPRRSFINGRLH